MLRLLIEKSRDNKSDSPAIKLIVSEIHLLASILIGGWLNTGFRNPECFGVHTSGDKDLEFQYVFFQAARLIFEHMFVLQ
jgi:hypothetical protein